MLLPKPEWEPIPSFTIEPREPPGPEDFGYPDVIGFSIHGLDDECKPAHGRLGKTPFQYWLQDYSYDAREVVWQITQGLGLNSAALKLLDEILGQDRNASIQLFACDVGGLIVKEALLIARSHPEAAYRSLFERTCLITFYGTPHRSTDAQSWETIALSLLNRCYHGRLGPWTTDFVTNFRQQQEKLAADFLPYVSRFRIVNYFQKSPRSSETEGPRLSPTVVIHASCASFGIDSETCIGLDRSYRGLPRHLGLRDEEDLETWVRDASISCGGPFRRMQSVFRVGDSIGFKVPDTPFSYRHIMSHFEALPRVAEWIHQSGFGVLQVQIGPSLSPVKLFRATRDSLRSEARGRRQVAFIHVDASLYQRERLTEPQVVASMCEQLLEQMPHLFLCVQDSLVNLEDAVTSSRDSWKTRAFWRCLESLLLQPKEADLYCLVHLGDDSLGRDQTILEQLHSLMGRSEARFKLLVASTQSSELPRSLQSDTAVVNLSTDKAAEILRVDLEEWADALVDNKPPSPSSRNALLSRLRSAKTFREVDDLLGFFAEEKSCRFTSCLISGLWKTLTDETYLHSLMTDQIKKHGRWLLVPIAWVIHVFRPISREELDAALAVEGNRHSNEPGTFDDFTYLLPGVLSTRQGTLFVAGGALPCFTQLWKTHFPEFPTAHTFLAERCVAVMSRFLEGWPSPQNQSPLGEFSSSAGRLLADYAAKHWVSHYQEALYPRGWVEVQRFLSSPQEVQAWLSYLRRSRGLGFPDDRTMCGLLSPRTLQMGLGISTELSVQVSRRLTDLELSSESDVVNALLIMGAEMPNMAIVQNITHFPRPESRVSRRSADMELSPESDSLKDFLILSAEMLPHVTMVEQMARFSPAESPKYDRRALCRAFATASDLPMMEEVLKLDAKLLVENYDKVLLTSIALGNYSTTEYLLDPTVRTSRATAESDLPTPLQVASLYGDQNVITRLLRPDEPWWDLEETRANSHSHSWNAIHLAAANGHGATLSEITRRLAMSGTGSKERLANSQTPEGNSPLVLAASRGLYGVAKQLLSLAAGGGREAQPEGGQPHSGDKLVACTTTNADGYTPLLAAASAGSCDLVRELLADAGAADLLACTTSNDNVLHLCLNRGYLEIANDILDKSAQLQSAGVLAVPTEPSSDSDDQFSSDGSDDEDDEDDRRRREQSFQNRFFDAPNQNGKTPFIIAAEWNMLAVMDRLQRLRTGKLGLFSEREVSSLLLLATKERSISLLDWIGIDSATKGLTVLDTACACGYAELVSRVLADSCDFGLQDRGWIPLLSAIRNGQTHVIPLLLPPREDQREEEIDSEKKNKAMTEALRLASSYGNDDIIDILLDRGADINAQDSYGNTALQLASYYEKPRCVELLLLRKARVDVSDSDGMTAVADATKRGSHESLNLLLGSCDLGLLEKTTSEGDTPLCMAIEAQQDKCLRLLLQHGAKLSLCSYRSSYQGLLDFALKVSSSDILRILVGSFAARSKHDQAARQVYEEEMAQALKAAVSYHRTNMLAILLDFYEDWAMECGNGWTIVHLAAAHGDASSLDAVLKHEKGRALMDAVAHKRLGPPLQLAAWSDKDPMAKVQCLLKAGAKASALHPGSRFGTALGSACWLKRINLVEVLLNVLTEDEVNYVYPNFNGGTAVRSACSYTAWGSDGGLEVLRLLRKHGARASHEGIDGTALHPAAENCSQEIVEELLSWPDVSKQTEDRQGRLPLHLAAADGKWDSLQLLTGPELPVTKTDKLGRNALHFAAGACSLEVVKGILDDEKNLPMIAVADNDGWTPLHWAARKCDESVVGYLVEKAEAYFGPRWDVEQKKLRTTDDRNWTPLQVALFHGRTETTTLLDQLWGSEEKANVDEDSEMVDVSPGHADGDISRIQCDSCLVPLAREQHHCMDDDCFDFDLCFKCIRHSHEIHPAHHQFEKSNFTGYVDYSQWLF